MVRSKSNYCTPLAVKQFPLRGDVDSLFNAFFGSDNPIGYLSEGPALNIAESEDGFEVSAELPGLSAENVHVELKDGLLSISGERKELEKTEGKKYHRVEHRYGSFSRSLQLGTTVDNDKVEAEFENGILTITVPKAEEVKPHKIQIKQK